MATHAIRRNLTGWELGKKHAAEEIAKTRSSPGAIGLAWLKWKHGDAYVLGRQAGLSRAGKLGGSTSTASLIDEFIKTKLKPVNAMLPVQEYRRARVSQINRFLPRRKQNLLNATTISSSDIGQATNRSRLHRRNTKLIAVGTAAGIGTAAGLLANRHRKREQASYELLHEVRKHYTTLKARRHKVKEAIFTSKPNKIKKPWISKGFKRGMAVGGIGAIGTAVGGAFAIRKLRESLSTNQYALMNDNNESLPAMMDSLLLFANLPQIVPSQVTIRHAPPKLQKEYKKLVNQMETIVEQVTKTKSDYWDSAIWSMRQADLPNKLNKVFQAMKQLDKNYQSIKSYRQYPPALML